MRKSTLLMTLAGAFGSSLLLTAIADRTGTPIAIERDIAHTPPLQELPYFTDFSEEASFDDWTSVNLNSEYTWKWYDYPTLGGCAVLEQVAGVGSACDNWLISPGFTLNASVTYQLQFYVQNWFDAETYVYLLDSADVATANKVLLYEYKGSEWGNKKIEFDPSSDGTYYIGFYDVTPWRENNTNLRYSVYLDDIRLEAMSNNALPEAPGELRQVPGANGEISMSLKWTNPVSSKLGETLDILGKANIYKDGRLVHTFETGVVPGEKMSWTDPEPTPGKHTYSVTVSNTTGESDPATVDTFIGVDSPGAPQNLSVDYDPEGGVITIDWERPEFGSKGGWFDTEGLAYRVVRQPGNKVLATNLEDELFEDTDLEEYGNYIYQVTTRTASGLGATAISQGVLAGGTASLPLIQGWENPDTYPAWSIVDNNDTHGLHVKNAHGYESSSCLIYDYRTTDVKRDETVYSPPVRLEKGKQYTMSFRGACNMFGEMSVEMSYGKEKTASSQTRRVATFAGVSPAESYELFESEFTAPETGTYYFSWRLFDGSGYNWLDDFRVAEVLEKNVTATAVHNLNTAPTAGDEIVTGVSYANNGSEKSSSFKVQLIDDDNTVLAEQNVSRPLAAGATGNANLKWIVPEVAGKFSVRGRVVMDDDMCTNDDTTEPDRITVLEKGTRAITIGTSSEVSESIPFTYYGNVVCETIYKGEDFNSIAGYINSLSIKVRFGMNQDYPGLSYRVFLGNTDRSDLTAGWINANMLTKVFDGTLDFNRGVYELEIPFDQPFLYTGGNLCLLIVSDHNETLMLDNGYGLGTFVSDYELSATRYWPSRYTKPDINNIEQSIGNYSSSVPNVIFHVDHSKTGTVTGTVTDTEGNPVEGVTVKGGAYPNLKAVTDKDGRYEIPYFPVGNAYLTASAQGYQQATGSGQIDNSTTAEIDITGMTPLVEIKFAGNIVDQRDNQTPVAGAQIYLSGDNTLTATTDEEGKFEIDGVYAFSSYPVFTISADGYETANYGGMTFRGSEERPYEWPDITLTPVTAAPYSVSAVDNGDKALISWENPVENIAVSKSGDYALGSFGGSYDIIIGQRYSSEEMLDAGVDDQYYLRSISFVPTCQSNFKIAVWQGEYGNEAKVYEQSVKDLRINEWNEFKLDRPLKIDPTKSLVVGCAIEALSGAFPVGFDMGPLVEGGDCLFDPIANAWLSAHEVLPESMKYNWCIRAKFGNNTNSAPVEWAQENQPARIVQLGEVISSAALAAEAETGSAVKASSDFGTMMFESPVAYMPAVRVPARTEVKGYNVYRLEPGQENSYIGMWTKLNETPVTEMSFTDESWSEQENKPYRFAVTSFYGNPNAWGDGVTSEPTFSDGVDKGRYATVSVRLSADRGDAGETTLVLTGDGKSVVKQTEPGNDEVIFENVRFSDYTLLIMKPYYDRIVADVTIDSNNVSLDYVLAFAARNPENFRATDYIKEARLNWDTPTTEMKSLLRWGNDNIGNTYAFNPGRETIVGQCSRPEQRAEYAYGDFYISGIRFYANAAVTYSPLVWSENKFGNQIQEWRQDYTVSDDEVGTWITVNLDTPLRINPENTYYYGYASTAPDSGTAPVAIDEGPYNNDGCCFYMYDQKEYKYNWVHSAASGNIMVCACITDTPDAQAAKEIDAKFDIFRLRAADSADESKWTKVNAEPVAGVSYTDSDWEVQAEDDWQYAVKALYFGDIASSASLSKVMSKGKVALVNVDLTTNNGLSSENARVAITGTNGLVQYKDYADADGHCEIPEVAKSKSFRIKVTAPGFEEINERLDATSDYVNLAYELKEIKELPGYVEAYPVADNSAVEVSWRVPGAYAPKEGWAYWDNNRPYAGYGTSVGFCAAAQLFEPEDQAEKGMRELDITRISFFPTPSSDNPVDENSYWIVKVWRINNDMTVSEVATQNATDVILGQWNEVCLDEPYHVDGTEMLLIGYEFHGSGNALGVDDGPCVIGKGDWANFGDGWQTLSTAASGFNFNNLIHVYCENLNVKKYEKAPALSEPQPMGGKPVKVSVSRADLAAKAADHKPIATYTYPVKGYLVYRMPESKMDNEAEWTLLTPEAVNETAFVDKNWADVNNGAYRWAVKAVYASGESEPAFCQFGLTEDGKVSEVESIAGGNIALSRISHNSVKITVPAEAMLEVVDVAGMKVLTCDLSEGANTVTVDTAEGIYLFRVICGNETRTFKFMIK